MTIANLASVQTETDTYSSRLFPGRLSINDKDWLYVMFQESECTEKESCQWAVVGEKLKINK